MIIQDRGPEDVVLNGKGYFIWSDGTTYHGEWRNNERSGYGEYEWPEGSYYQGAWKHDMWMGDGTYTNQHGVKFTGKWHHHTLLPGEIKVFVRDQQSQKVAIETPKDINELDYVQEYEDFVQ